MLLPRVCLPTAVSEPPCNSDNHDEDAQFHQLRGRQLNDPLRKADHQIVRVLGASLPPVLVELVSGVGVGNILGLGVGGALWLLDFVAHIRALLSVQVIGAWATYGAPNATLLAYGRGCSTASLSFLSCPRMHVGLYSDCGLCR